MVLRVRRFFDVRPGEGRRVLFSFLYVAVVVAAFLLARPIRNGLFLERVRALRPGLRLCGRAAGPVAVRADLRARCRPVRLADGDRRHAGVLQRQRRCCSGMRSAFHAARSRCAARRLVLPGVFYVWVNCFGVIAPVQAWTLRQLRCSTHGRRGGCSG